MSEADDARERELDDTRHVMASPNGRRLMWRLLARARIFHDIGPASADRHNYESGTRGYGLFIYNELKEADRDAFAKMEFENTTLLEAELAQKAREKDDE